MSKRRVQTHPAAKVIPLKRSAPKGMRAILMGAVPHPLRHFKSVLGLMKLVNRDFFIGVDGGIQTWLKLGICPDLAVGDWDSLIERTGSVEKAQDLLNQVSQSLIRIGLPQNKDRSDLYYAVKAAVSEGATRVVCLGVTGGRPDHHLAMILDLMEAAKDKGLEELRAVGPDADYYFLAQPHRKWSARLRPGQTVSVFAFGKAAVGVSLRGFQFPLKDTKLLPSSHGLSNVVKSKRCDIEFASGSLLVVIPHE